jgi:protein TonB
MSTQVEKFIIVIALAGAVLGCDKRSRTRNSAGSLDDSQESRPMASANVYRFTGVEQSLSDARRAVAEERWDEAIAATDALLKQQPGNTEAQSINHQARLEAPNQLHYADFMKAAGAAEVAAAMKQYRQIAEGSLYRDKARIAYEKLRTSYVDAQESEARAYVRAGRCDEARRAVRVTSDWFPEMRARMDEAASGCRPARGESESRTAALEKGIEREEKPVPTPMAAAVATPTPIAPAPVTVASEPKPAPEPPKALAAAPSVPPPAPARSLVAEPPAAPSAPPRNVPIAEMEAYRVAGDKMPKLPAGANMIAHRDGVKRMMVGVKLCVSETGAPTSATLVKASDYADANERILAEVKRWRFRPYLYNGQPIPVCTATLLNYQIE